MKTFCWKLISFDILQETNVIRPISFKIRPILMIGIPGQINAVTQQSKLNRKRWVEKNGKPPMRAII